MKDKLLKKSIIFGIVVLFLGASVLPTVSSEILDFEFGDTLYVGGSGPGNYTSIQDAIDDASNGDTIFVYSGTYYENIIIDVSIDLIGEDKDTTIISGDGNGHVVELTSDDVTITGFKIRNGGGYLGASAIHTPTNNVAIYENIFSDNMFGVKLYYSSNVDITDNIFTDNSWRGIEIKGSTNTVISNNQITYSGVGAIWIDGSAQNILIQNNIIKNNGDGIHVSTGYELKISENYIADNEETGVNVLYSPYVIIEDNDIINHTWNNIWITYSDYLHVSGNYITNNHVGYNMFSSGIFIDLTSHGIVENNEICNVYSNGILVQFSTYLTIRGNNIINNDDNGIWFRYDSTQNTVVDNLIKDNDVGIYTWSGSSNNVFHHNDVINNFQHTWSSQSYNNVWDDGSEGNYWDNYEGLDEDENGIGDTPHNVYDGVDNYPIMIAIGITSNPPNKPTIDGVLEGQAGIYYTYYGTTDDPDSDDIRYVFDWDDGSYTLTGYCISGETGEADHMWPEQGTYSVRVKARDRYGYESEWSDPLEITMPLNQPSSQPSKPFQRVLQIPNAFPILRQLFGL